jgi:spermidine/putrescine-binding protein
MNPGLRLLARALLLWPCLCAVGAAAEETAPLRVLTWGHYFPTATIEEFQREAGSPVELITYESNEELQERISSGLVGVDVIVPSDYMVRILGKQGQLASLQPDRLPNLKHVDPRFCKLAFDPTNRYSVPYAWGTTGIGVNRLQVRGDVDTLALLFDERHRGKIMMFDDARACLGLALRMLGKSANSRKSADIDAAKAKLLEQRPLVLAYSGEKYVDALVDGTILVCTGYSGDVLRAHRANSAIAYVVPREGTILWVDNLCILETSAHKDLAHRFLGPFAVVG